MDAKSNRQSFPSPYFIKLAILLALVIVFQVPAVWGDSAQYFYDDSGRLTRVVKGTSGVIYKYDELGNLLSATSTATTTGSPVISSINPNVLFVGSKILVTITGQNFLTTDAVTSNGGLVAIDNVAATDTQITAEMTALSAGTDTIKVTTRNGTPNMATIDVTLTSSTLTFSPAQMALAPGTSAGITVSISPAPALPLTINLRNNAPTTVTAPQSVTIPTSGSTSFNVQAQQIGDATISAGDPRTMVFVTTPFTGDVTGLKAGNVSVYIDAPNGTSSKTATPVSVNIDAPAGASPNTAAPVSVYVDSPGGSSPTTTNPVSVLIQ